jgi:ferredoxin
MKANLDNVSIKKKTFFMKIYLTEAVMAYTINDDCTNCGACEPECPVEAISEKGGKRVIDPDLCTDCGSCEAVCPVEAIHPE